MSIPNISNLYFSNLAIVNNIIDVVNLITTLEIILY